MIKSRNNELGKKVYHEARSQTNKQTNKQSGEPDSVLVKDNCGDLDICGIIVLCSLRVATIGCQL